MGGGLPQRPTARAGSAIAGLSSGRTRSESSLSLCFPGEMLAK